MNYKTASSSAFLLVVGVLLFFLGLRNALFVGVAIPLSMFLSFAILNALGITFNVMVLFCLGAGPRHARGQRHRGGREHLSIDG